MRRTRAMDESDLAVIMAEQERHYEVQTPTYCAWSDSLAHLALTSRARLQGTVTGYSMSGPALRTPILASCGTAQSPSSAASSVHSIAESRQCADMCPQGHRSEPDRGHRLQRHRAVNLRGQLTPA